MLASGISYLPGRGSQHNLRSDITRLTKVKRAFHASGHAFRLDRVFIRSGRFLLERDLRHSMDVTNIDRVAAFSTKDGSEIRELLAHRNSCIRHQSLAEARLPPHAATTPHYHPQTEEIYYILEGRGSMQVDKEIRSVGPGDAIAIPPGTRHQIRNTDSVVLKFLCCCAPAYEDEDTVLE